MWRRYELVRDNSTSLQSSRTVEITQQPLQQQVTEIRWLLSSREATTSPAIMGRRNQHRRPEMDSLHGSSSTWPRRSTRFAAATAVAIGATAPSTRPPSARIRARRTPPQLGKLSSAEGEATPPSTPPDSAAWLAASCTSGEDANVASPRYTNEDYAVHLVPPLDQPLHVQQSTTCTVSSPSATDLAASLPSIVGDSSSRSRLEVLDPLTFTDFQRMPVPPSGRLPKPHCNVLMAQLRDYLHTAVPAPLMDVGVGVVDLHAYIAKIDREFKTQREAVSFIILDTKFDMILGMSWLRSEDHPVNFFHRTVHIRDRNGILVSCTVRLPHPSISCHVVSAASMRASIIRDDIEEIGVCFLHALPPHDTSSTDSPSDPRITELLDTYFDVFEGPHGVVPDRPIRHEIILEDGAVPPRGCIYRMSKEELSVLRAQLDDLFEKGRIRPSSSPHDAPVLFVWKKNKDLRLCIDYRKLNAQMIRNAGPFPRIDDLLERLGGAKFFSKLELKSGYHQLEIRKEDRYKTAFKTRYGHFEWLVMPFGLTNALVTFQAAMTTEFRHMLDRYVLIYLDDILVYSRSLEEHVEHLRTVLEWLRQAKYKASDKCEFARQELEYLGHYVTPQGIRPLADKIEALRVWPEPTNTTDVRSFMGLAGYYQRFITGYSRITGPMTRLQSPKVPFIFDDDARQSFQALKTTMLMAPVLSIYDPTLPTRVTTEASGYGIGAVLEQHDGDDWHPVEYFSHKVPPINSLDDARKKELLAFVMALKRWQHFLLGRRRFTWVTDNNPLTYFIDQFDFTQKHLPGLSNRVADALSRRPDLCAMTHHAFAFDEELQRHFIWAYESDPDFATLYAQLSSDHPPASHYRIADGYLLLHLRGKDLLRVPRDRRLRTRRPFRSQSPAISESTARLHGFHSDSDGPISLPMSLSIATLAKFADAASPATAIPTAKDIISDRDTRFMSAFWTSLMQESGTKMKPSSAWHPQMDGQMERAHQTAQMMLRTLIRPDQKHWVDRLPDIEFAYNTSVHPVIGVTPFELHHGGRKGRIFADLLLPRPTDIDAACSPASVQKYRELLTQARANMQKAQVRMQQQANRCRVPCPIHAGDLVWVSAEEFALEQDVSRKLLPKWFRPWSVTAAAGDEPDGPSFVINIPEHLTVHPVFHASKLATHTPAKSDDFPGRRSQDPPSMDGHQEVDRVITDRKYCSKPRQYKVTFKACDRDDTRPAKRKEAAIAAELAHRVPEKEPPTGVVPRPIQHRIEIEPGSRTPKGAVYRMSPRELQELHKQLDELLKKGWIRPSSSPFGAPVLFVPKKEGELRMCIDHRGLNAITVKNVEPLPRIDDLLDWVQGCRYFSKIDLKSGYHQVEVHPDNQYKTAFRTRYGHYEFIVMPFGLTNAPATFQRCMNDLFRPWLDRFVAVYLDDILVFNRTFQEHRGHLRQVLEKLREDNFKINVKKCEWARAQVLYLGHALDGDGIKPEDSKITVIRDWPTPRTLTALRSFLGLANYYRKFVRNVSTIAAHLRRLLKKEAIWQWDKDNTSALKKLKRALIEYPVLKAADPSLPVVVTTDASQYGIGAVLQQDDDNGYKPVEFMSARMPSEKVATSTYERELYALRQALEHWKHYLLGRLFKVYSNHETLRWLKTQAKLTPKLTRWVVEIDQYDFELKPLKAKYNVVADALSRISDYFGAISLPAALLLIAAGLGLTAVALSKVTTQSSQVPVAFLCATLTAVGFAAVRARGRDFCSKPRLHKLR
ncbi:hypothetical protein CBR_g32130 [Chara braunii]|uniref:Reverse transcriptase n=1 Tax=Chara braunii TaxID=69332 RepID=A0A388JN28_CHABU|nr:hypothetical protein CBR_g32130 [Chara braunii]|eukprot:GBG59112.1 hypothetical protein CBR_g32130 [Chara braunii]